MYMKNSTEQVRTSILFIKNQIYKIHNLEMFYRRWLSLRMTNYISSDSSSSSHLYREISRIFTMDNNKGNHQEALGSNRSRLDHTGTQLVTDPHTIDERSSEKEQEEL
ncbi:hypothetical protein Dimus_023979 [Dionaea muscipula]